MPFSNDIKIELGIDENQFYRNNKVKENLQWEDFMFNYHTGICYIIKTPYKPFRSGHDGCIMKVPEVSWKMPDMAFGNGRLEETSATIENRENQDYYNFGFGYLGFDNWKSAVLNFISMRKELYAFNQAKYKAIDELREKESKYNNSSNYQPSYNKYGGYMGYDDDTIDDAFEGDPSNIWNVE